MAKTNSWRGQDWSSDCGLWELDHPLFRALGAALSPEIVATPYGATEVCVPDIDAELLPIVAAFAVVFTARFYKAQRRMPTIALEAVALLYCNLGGTDGNWRVFLDRLGVKIAPQSRNLFISFLVWICGHAVNKSNKLGKMANALDLWAAIYRPGPATLGDQNSDDWGWPDPVFTEEDGPGSSVFAQWLQDGHGYSRITKAYAESSKTITTTDPTPSPEPSPTGSGDGSPETPEPEPEPEPKPSRVWVVNPHGDTEFVFASKDNAQNHLECHFDEPAAIPIWEQDAEDFDLEGFEADYEGEYLRPGSNEPPERVKGRPVSPGFHDDDTDDDTDGDAEQEVRHLRTVCENLGMTEADTNDPAVQDAIAKIGEDDAQTMQSLINNHSGKVLCEVFYAVCAKSDNLVELADIVCDREYGESYSDLRNRAKELELHLELIEKERDEINAEADRLGREMIQLREELDAARTRIRELLEAETTDPKIVPLFQSAE
jgi:hypothetical protein